MSILSFIGGIFEPAAKLIDDLHTSAEEKLIIKSTMLKVQTEFLAKAIDMETRALESKAKIIEAEAKSDSWITRSWRPLTMLSFVAAILAYWFGLTPDNIPEEAISDMFTLVQIGIGGYVTSRGAEKIVPGILKAMKEKEKT